MDTEAVVTLTITPEQRDALYACVLDDLDRFEELRRSWEIQDLEVSYRLGRTISDGRQLIFEGLGWGSHMSNPVSLTMPPADLKRILSRLRDNAVALCDWEKPEREAIRAEWERTATVRDTCDQLLAELGQAKAG